MTTPQDNRFWRRVGSPRAVQIIFALMVVYFVVIGGLVFGYAKVQSCLTDYTDESARNTTTRSQLAADDRALNLRTDEVDASDRVRIIADNEALIDFVTGIQSGRSPSASQFAKFQKVNQESKVVFAVNQRERSSIAKQRARVDALRSTVPPPAAPSDRC